MQRVRPIIIGGTNGLGLELAKLAARQDHRTLVMGRQVRPQHGKTIMEHMGFWPLDLTSNTSIMQGLAHLDNNRLFLEQVTHIVLAAGVGFQGSLMDQSFESVDTIVQVLISGPLKFMSGLLKMVSHPIHVVTISSTSSAKVRPNETTYGAAKAGQAQMARNLHQELVLANKQSKSTLVHPGGMVTDFYQGSATNTSGFMDPTAVALIIWGEVLRQVDPWLEFCIPRADPPRPVHGTPKVEFP